LIGLHTLVFSALGPAESKPVSRVTLIEDNATTVVSQPISDEIEPPQLTPKESQPAEETFESYLSPSTSEESLDIENYRFDLISTPPESPDQRFVIAAFDLQKLTAIPPARSLLDLLEANSVKLPTSLPILRLS